MTCESSKVSLKTDSYPSLAVNSARIVNPTRLSGAIAELEFKENKPMMDIVRNKLKADSIIQYKIEERSTISRRLIISDERMKLLINIMKKDTVSKKENVENLKNEILK